MGWLVHWLLSKAGHVNPNLGSRVNPCLSGVNFGREAARRGGAEENAGASQLRMCLSSRKLALASFSLLSPVEGVSKD